MCICDPHIKCKFYVNRITTYEMSISMCVSAYEMFVLCVCMSPCIYACALSVDLVPMEGRRHSQILWN